MPSPRASFPPAAQCAPKGNLAYGFCVACDGDNPSWCTKCENPELGQGVYSDSTGACQYCGTGCLRCENKTGQCTECDTGGGYTRSELGGCIPLPP